MNKDKRISIFFIIPSLRGGGAERFIITLVNNLDYEKFKPTLVVLDASDGVYLSDIPQEIDFIALEANRVRNGIYAIAKLLYKRKPDIVFSTMGHLNLAIGMVRPLLSKKMNFIARESNILSEVLKAQNRGYSWKFAYRLFYRFFDKVVCQSKDMYEDLLLNFHFPANKALVINNPVEIEKIRNLAATDLQTGFDNRKVNLVAAGRLTHQKGFDILLEALALTQNSNIHLTLLGKGKDEQKLKRIARSLGIAKQLTFAGFQKNPYPYFSKADLFVLSSRYEGFPNVVLETLACGTPVLATPCLGGIFEILSEIDGCMIADAIIPTALSQKLATFDFDAHFDKKAVEKWDAGKITKKYQNLFRAVIA